MFNRNQCVLGVWILCGFWTLAAAQKKEKPVKNALARNPAAIQAGGQMFAARCSFCHGTDGKGTGRGSNLTTGDWTHGGGDGELYDTIKKGISGTEMPPHDLPEEQIWQLVAFVRSLGTGGYQPPVAGNAEHGEELFFGKARCSTCHMIRGKGSPFGPELSNIGAARSASKIRSAILDPGAEIRPDSSGAKITLRNGESFEALIRNEDNFSLQLVERTGRFRLLDKRDVARLTRLDVSLMPADVGRVLSPDELQDLLAFLDRQRLSEEDQSTEAPKP
jgi:putative heme-binding domain-containing protein